MRARDTIVVFGLLGQLLFAFHISPAYGAQGKEQPGDRGGGRSGEKRQEKKTEWSADPDRGWVRTDEPAEPEKQKSEKPKSQNRKNSK